MNKLMSGGVNGKTVSLSVDKKTHTSVRCQLQAAAVLMQFIVASGFK